MISRQNRAPTGRTSNRPTGDSGTLASARSTGNLNSSRTFEPPAMHSPIQRPSARASTAGSNAWSAPQSSRNDEGFKSSRECTASGRKKTPQYTYGGRDFYLPDDRLKNSASKANFTSRNLLEKEDTSLDDLTQLSTREIIQRLRDRGNQEEKAMADLKALEESEYNDFSRPRPSTLYPHRTVFLDPKINNISPSKTQTELKKKMKNFSIPHPSYDIDGDGDISHEDYRLAKRFDFDGNGIIDPYERKIAKHVIADEFFSKHNEHMHVFGDEIANATHTENVTRLSKAPNFERTLVLLKGVEDSLRGRSSKEMVGCMASVHADAVKKNYYTDKFNTTAFTNFEAVPVSTRDLGGAHNGSRLRLMESRKFTQKQDCSDRMKVAQDKLPKFSTVKLKMPYD
mmetsp:Transcript_2605/g.4744  ORF Transcript_2605/g.4744 Transcript_2605/m.4744 type:complete len:399 (-) Transcript_2605:260-1456(-)|eukprot:CAMPEP_0114420384 /NCGR_PEP_ID=MMETSP0103-20121206/4529_1 /TAXON_ID=37642 ORGANISM="Paraphysomonas imperforata, Strain PA2" /NCGR_SAMPLE_ID=MMETSP0103 /ASSEMBLY_ACC=CAM_ASM_000201 /LENGTH=398 /DNA_ID=CAMNT_0001588861 /DNA_START=61 /DNA_END=1257 /DNA_ORIENTATION=-